MLNLRSKVILPRGRAKIMDVEAILGQYKSTSVPKDVELQYDLGNLLASDLNSLDTESLR